MKAYLKSVLALAGFALLGIGGFNYLVDPADFFASPRWDSINRYKPSVAHSLYIVKPWQGKAAAAKPLDTLILGTSRAGGSINPLSPVLAAERAYNFALPLASIYQLRQAYAHMRGAKPKQLLLTLDFFTFNHRKKHNIPGHDSELENRLRVDDSAAEAWHQWGQFATDALQLLLTLDATAKSLRTWEAQAALQQGQQGAIDLTASGYWNVLRPAHRRMDQHFKQGLEFSVRRFCDAQLTFTFHDPKQPHPSTFEQLERLLAQVYQDGVATTIAIPAVHGWYLAALHECGLWSTREQWKRQLVAINQRQAKLAGRQAFPIWDFSNLNPVTMERIPRTSTMRWFHDIDHPTPAAGEAMLSRLRGTQASPPLDAYGQLLNSDNIALALQQERQAIVSYLAAEPALSAQLAGRVRARVRQQSQRQDREFSVY